MLMSMRVLMVVVRGCPAPLRSAFPKGLLPADMRMRADVRGPDCRSLGVKGSQVQILSARPKNRL